MTLLAGGSAALEMYLPSMHAVSGSWGHNATIACHGNAQASVEALGQQAGLNSVNRAFQILGAAFCPNPDHEVACALQHFL